MSEESETTARLDSIDSILDSDGELDFDMVSSHQFQSGNYTRGCKFSPDGLCLLVCNNDRKLRIFELPKEADWQPVLTMQESGTIYDYTWYPLMDSTQPTTCFLAVTAQHQPVHIYDAYNGKIRATFRVYNHLDEVEAARSLAFSPQGDKLYAGLKNEVRVFDVNVPGRECETRKTYTKQDGGTAGIVSSIAVNPAMSQVYAVGTYAKDLGVYVEPEGQALCYLEGQKGGITHLAFSGDGTKLVAGGRKDCELLVWDMRNPGQLYSTLTRQVSTNQRIYFDIDSSGSYLCSGSTNGNLTIWNLSSIEEQSTGIPYQLKTTHQQKLCKDCLNGVSCHPYSPQIAISTGQRHFIPHTTDSDSDDSDSSQEENCLSIMKVTTKDLTL